MNVLSLFDGMSCGRIALERAGHKIDNYYASEIKKEAIELVSKRYPQNIQLGDVRNIHYTTLGIEVDTGDSSMRVIGVDIDLLIGGSPCKGGSGLNQNREGLKHDESILFYDFLRILKEIRYINPSVKFLLENVPGHKEMTKTITKELGVRPLRLNSSCVSAQNRVRLYWTNIPVTNIPKNKRVTTKDVFDDKMPMDLLISEGKIKWLQSESGKKSVRRGFTKINPYPKSGCLTANGHKKWNCNYIEKDGLFRVLSIRELEQLQTLPEGYCDGMEYGDAYDLIGDGWTIDIISHIFSFLPTNT